MQTEIKIPTVVPIYIESESFGRLLKKAMPADTSAAKVVTVVKNEKPEEKQPSRGKKAETPLRA
jgi:hypothetical protein